MKLYRVIALLVIVQFVSTKQIYEWKSRSIYQVLTDRFARTDGSTSPCSDLSNYCGGTYQGIINNLDYIQDMGFNAIWISPIVKNLEGGYHGYWATDLYSLNENFGTEQDFINLIKELHKRDMWIMVDVVANHMAPVGEDYSGINPFNKPEHYHDYCLINDEDFGNNQWRVENCRLAGLPDLKQEDEYVRSTLLKWIKDFVKKYDIDGLRIDTIPEVPKDFWKEFQKAADCYTVGEVFDGRVDYVSDYQNYIDGVLNYPLRYLMKDVWQDGKSFYGLKQRLEENSAAFKDVAGLWNFIDNHDNARFLHSNSNMKAFKAALLFGLFTEGIPIVYYGSEQAFGGGDDPKNREQLWTNMDTNHELYQTLKMANKYRNGHPVSIYPQIERYVDDNFYAFSRGIMLACFTNTENPGPRTLTSLPYEERDKICNIFDMTDCLIVTGHSVTINLDGYKTKIYTQVARTVSE